MKSRGLKITAVVLLVAFLSLSAGCSASPGFISDLIEQLQQAGNRQTGSQNLSAQQLVQKIADAIRNRADAAETFNSIPESQRDLLTLDQFQQYLNLLARGIGGSVISYSKMSREELDLARTTIAERVSVEPELLKSLAGYWIYYRGGGQAQERFAIYIKADDEGNVKLSSEWIEQLLDLNRFATLYFDALNQGNQDALCALLNQTPLPGEIIELRAARLIDYYQKNIASSSDEFRLTHARIDSIGFEEFNIANPDKTTAVSRTIEILQAGHNEYLVQDVLPEKIRQEDLQVLYNAKMLFTFGQDSREKEAQVVSGELESIIGAPVLHDDTVCRLAANGVQQLDLTYKPLKLKAEGSCFRHSRWSGVVTDITLIQTPCSIGSGLHPGASVEKVLRRYPFAAEAGFLIQGESDLGEVKLIFEMEDDRIKTIRLVFS